MDFFETSYLDVDFLDSRDRGDYSKAVAELIISVEGLNIIADIATEIASTVENMDKLQIIPDYTNFAKYLGMHIDDSLPRLMEVLHDDGVPQDVIACLQKSHTLDTQLMDERR